MVKPYINYMEKLFAMGINRGSGNTRPSQPLEMGVGWYKEEGNGGSWSRFDAYTPLNTSRENFIKSVKTQS